MKDTSAYKSRTITQTSAVHQNITRIESTGHWQRQNIHVRPRSATKNNTIGSVRNLCWELSKKHIRRLQCHNFRLRPNSNNAYEETNVGFKNYFLFGFLLDFKGSGKTYTINGNSLQNEEVGIIPRAINEMFKFIKVNLYNAVLDERSFKALKCQLFQGIIEQRRFSKSFIFGNL